MYVFDTTLEPETSLVANQAYQRLAFRLPEDVMTAVKRDQRRMLKRLSTEKAAPPWHGDGRVCFIYSASTGSSTPVFVDRRDSPLGDQGLQRVRPGCKVRLTLRQVWRRQQKPGTKLQVLKAQILHLDAPHQGGLASPHSIQEVSLALPLDLLQDVERLALHEDWSTQAWLRNAIETQVRRTRHQLGLDESMA